MHRLRTIGRLRAGGSGFNPLTLFAAGEQGAWYDPSDLSTQFQDSAGTTPVTAAGQPVGKVLDKSGRGNHLVQATTTSRPTLQQDASGYWYWNFDGVDDSWGTAATVDFSGTDKVSAFAGVYKGQDAATAIMFEFTADTNANNGAFYFVVPNSASASNAAFVARGTVLPAGGASASTWATTTARVASMSGDIAGAAQTLRLNGVAGTPSAASLGTGNLANATFFVGRRNNASVPFTGRLYQLVLRGALSNVAQVAAAERFVGSKMGIAL